MPLLENDHCKLFLEGFMILRNLFLVVIMIIICCSHVSSCYVITSTFRFSLSSTYAYDTWSYSYPNQLDNCGVISNVCICVCVSVCVCVSLISFLENYLGR